MRTSAREATHGPKQAPPRATRPRQKAGMRRVGCGAADSEAARENGGRFGATQTDGGQIIERCAIAGKPNRAKARFFVASDRNAAPRPPTRRHLQARPQQRAVPNAQFSNNWPLLRVHARLRSKVHAGKKPQTPINDATGPVKPAKKHHCPRAANRAQGYNSVANH